MDIKDFIKESLPQIVDGITEAESKLSAINDLLCINPKPLGKRKYMLHPNQISKKTDADNQRVI